MKRWLFNIFSALSLLLFVSVGLLWVRSYYTRDIVSVGWAGGNGHTLQSILGRVHILSDLGGGCTGWFSHTADDLVPQAIWGGGMSSYPLKVNSWCGFVWQTYTRFSMGFDGSTWRTRHRLIVVPHGFAAALFAVLPGAWVLNKWRRRRRLRNGLCAACGYDLRASVDRCPECGTPIPAGALPAGEEKAGLTAENT